MVSLLDDQAAGLRRLFSGACSPATIVLAGPAGAQGATGRSVLVAELARGLAAAGKEVLILDEHAGAESVAGAFGVRTRYDLLQALNRDVQAGKVLLQAETSIRLLPAARAVRQHARLDAVGRRTLGEWLRRLQRGADFVLVNAADRADAELSPLLPPQFQRIVIALPTDAASITGAYALMKRLAQRRDCRRFSIVIMHAASRAEGRAVFDNLCEVARRHLGAALELLGVITAQDGAAGMGQPLADAFLDLPREDACSRHAAAGQGLRNVPHGLPLSGAAVAHPVV